MDCRHLTSGSSGLAGQARSQLNRMLEGPSLAQAGIPVPLNLTLPTQQARTVREVAERLHAWLKAERADTFADLELGDSRDPRMDELVLFLRSKFAIKTK